MKQNLLDRNLYRQIKSMDKNELSQTLNNIYEMGKEDAMKGIEAVDINIDKIRSEIGAIKGIGKTRLNQIVEIIASNLSFKKYSVHPLRMKFMTIIHNYLHFIFLTIADYYNIINISKKGILWRFIKWLTSVQLRKMLRKKQQRFLLLLP
ncbi:hypothetical protein [Huintestinicola sp.]